MGWKNFKQHYGIKFLSVEKGVVHVGSPMLPSLFGISLDGKDLTVWKPLVLQGSQLEALYNRISAEREMVERLLVGPDTFENTQVVYTFDNDGNILAVECEEFGWPNLTVAGELMYENTHFKTFEEAKKNCLESLSSMARCYSNLLQDAQAQVSQFQQKLLEVQAATRHAQAATSASPDTPRPAHAQH